MRGFFKWWGFFCAFLNVEIKYAGGNTLGLIFELSSYWESHSFHSFAIPPWRDPHIPREPHRILRISFIQITPFRPIKLLHEHSMGSQFWPCLGGLCLYSLSSPHLLFWFLICAKNVLLASVSKDSLKWKELPATPPWYKYPQHFPEQEEEGLSQSTDIQKKRTGQWPKFQ